MKKLYFIIPVALLAIYLAYVLPFGLDQNKLEKDLKASSFKISSFAEELSNLSLIDDLNTKIEGIIQTKVQFEDAKKQFDNLALKRNFIRNNTWKKQTLYITDILNMDSQLKRVIYNLNINISNSIKMNSEGVASDISETSSITDIKNRVENYKRSLSNLSEILDKLNRNNIDTTIVLNKKDLKIVFDNNSIIVKKIGIIQTNYRNNFYTKIKSTNSVKEINSEIITYMTFLGEVKNSFKTISEIGVNTSMLNNASSLVQNDISQINNIIDLLKKTLIAEGNSNELLKSALQTMDDANSKLNNMEKFASSGDILEVYNSWSQAENEVRGSLNPLYFSGNSSTHEVIWNNLTDNAKQNINKILSDVGAHKSFVYNEYSKAVNEESTFIGGTGRDLKRGWNRLVDAANEALDQAQSSRIGRELSLSTKMLILGTKAFYDLQNPGTDPLTWAMSYESDVNSLMTESDEIMEMDGPSLTGKNTFIESYVDKAYDKSFNK